MEMKLPGSYLENLKVDKGKGKIAPVLTLCTTS
jgi:hypothetical protein